MALHVLDNGICVTCTEQQRGKHSVQDEPREPHSGKWVHGAGSVESAAKHAWGAESIQLGGHQVDLEPVHDPKLKYSDERQIKLTVHAPDGPHTVTLTSDAAYNIASILHEPHETIGIQKLHVAKGRAGAETEHGTGFVGVRRIGDDEYQVRFGGGDGSSPEKIYTTVVAGRKDLDRLSGALARAAAADTRDIKAGPVRIHGRKDGNWELDLPATSGQPVQLTMSADDVTKVSHELQTALGLINDSEYVDDEAGYRPKAHDAGQIVREVNLPTTVLRIEATGSAGKEQLHLQSHAHDWTLNLPESDVQEIVDMLADSPVWHSSEAEGLTRSAQHELRGAGPSATWHPMVNGECTQCDADDLLDEDSAALLHALNELDGPLGGERAAFDPSKHLRNPKGSPGGGRFRSNVDKLKDAITAHRKGEYDGHPFDGFSREQLRRVAKARGIELGRGESKESISTKLLGHLDEKPAVTSPVRKTTSTGKLQPHVSGEAERDLNAKVRAAKKNLTPGQLKAVEQWTSGKGMVRKIQTGQVSAETANNFDEAMKTLPKVDGLVYRAVSSHGQSSQFAADLKPGQVLDLGAPVSTSIDPRQSGSFGTNLYEIESPSASYLAGVGSKFGYEKEAVLPPGQYEVVSSEYATIGLGKNTAKVLVVRLKDVTQGDRSWKPTTGTDFKLHEPDPSGDTPSAKAVEPRTVEQMQADQDAVVREPLTPERKQALQAYSMSAYGAINGYLRGRPGHENHGPGLDRMIDEIRASMIPLPHDAVLERASGWAGLPEGFRDPEAVKGLVGKTITDPGFASTSVPGAALAIPAGDGVLMQIEAPAGTSGRLLKDVSRIPDEDEYLIDAGSRYKVLGVDGSNPTVIRMRVVRP